jgi:hypothetical protein
MAVGSISSVIDGGFLAQFSGMRVSSAPGAEIPKFTSSDQVSTTLSTGTRVLTRAYQNLGQAVGFVNGTLITLSKLGKVVEDVVRVAETASRTTSSSARARLSTEYRQLGEDFAKIVEEAKLGGLNLLSEDDLKNVLVNVGLDPEKASGISTVVARFITPDADRDLADTEVKDLRPLRLPDEEIPDGGGGTEIVPGTPPVRHNDVFSPARTIRTRGDALALAADSKKLLSNIKANLSAVNDLRNGIIDNMDLVRATALGLRTQSNDPSMLGITTAQGLADRLQGLILDNVNPSSLSEAGNLDGIVSASLLYG